HPQERRRPPQIPPHEARPQSHGRVSLSNSSARASPRALTLVPPPCALGASYRAAQRSTISSSRFTSTFSVPSRPPLFAMSHRKTVSNAPLSDDRDQPRAARNRSPAFHAIDAIEPSDGSSIASSGEIFR